jgi:hypothetical protein
VRHLSHEPLIVSRGPALRQPSVSRHVAVGSMPDPRAISLATTIFRIGFKVGLPRSLIKSIGDTRNVARTYPLRIGVLRFQVNEQLLRVPIKQRRKVCDSGGIPMLSGIGSRVISGNDQSLIRTLKGNVCSRERTSSYIKCNKSIFLPTVRISSRLACEPAQS